ncbi:MAG: proteasome accessory factor PafA2 family protein [Candidatus Sungbacteria bacterium]|nr:proteasome accessory factor PafA2 family protein [Candidatus Sungbacteria bacterium]
MGSQKTERIIHRIMGAENELSSPEPFLLVKESENQPLILRAAVSKQDRRRLINPDDDSFSNRRPKAVLPNQGIIYIDNEHVEYSTPECLGALELALFESAGLQIMTQMMRRLKRKTGLDFKLYKTNRNCCYDVELYPMVDLDVNSWGSHANYLVKKSVFSKRSDFFELIIPFLISRWCLIGNGWIKINATDNTLQFVLSQRAEVMKNNRKAEDKPSFFSKKDSQYADKTRWRRHHDVSGNSTMSAWQLFLKYATLDIILTMAEEKFLKIPPNIYPMDLFEASLFFNADPGSKNPVSLLEEGLRWNALDFQRFYIKQAQEFFAGPGRQSFSPERKLALNLWENIIDAIAHWDLPYLAQFLDWAAILHYFIMPYLKSRGFDPEAILPRGEERPVGKIPTSSNQDVLRDILEFISEYAFMDTAQSPYGQYLRAGLIKKLFPENLVRWATQNPPERTRANWREEILRIIFSRELDKKCLVDSVWEEFTFVFNAGKRSAKILYIKNLDPERYKISARDRKALAQVNRAAKKFRPAISDTHPENEDEINMS